jgi:hypothetical protein
MDHPFSWWQGQFSKAIGMTFQNDDAAMADAEKQAEELCGRWLQWLQAWLPWWGIPHDLRNPIDVVSSCFIYLF